MRRHFCEHILDDFFYHNKPLLYTDIVKDRGFLCQLLTQLYSESKNKLELAVSNFLSLSNKTIEKNTSAYFDLKPTIPSGYTLVGAFIRDTQALENGIIPIYSLATQGSISFRVVNMADQTITITETMKVSFYLLIKKG